MEKYKIRAIYPKKIDNSFRKLTQNCNAIEQIIHTQFQTANPIIDFGARHIVKYMTVLLV